MCDNTNFISGLIESLSQAQRASNAEILPIIYRIIDNPVNNTPEKTVKEAAQRFLDFYLSNTALAEDVYDLDMHDYYDALVKKASGVFFALDVMSGEFYEGVQVAFATAMDKLFATYREYFMALEEFYEDDCDCDCCDDDCDCDCDDCDGCDDCDCLSDDEDDLDDDREYMDCHTCSAECNTCRRCCTGGNKDEETPDSQTNKCFSEILDEAIRETRKNNEQTNAKAPISDSEAAARLFSAIFGLDINQVRRNTPKETK